MRVVKSKEMSLFPQIKFLRVYCFNIRKLYPVWVYLEVVNALTFSDMFLFVRVLGCFALGY